MRIERELMMKRRYVWVEGIPEIPLPLILHKLKKCYFMFT
jgi:hypothetical protein